MRLGWQTLWTVAALAIAMEIDAAVFEDDLAFLRQHTQLIVLNAPNGTAQVAVAPAWQGRVVTSSAQGAKGRSFGWINRKLITSGQILQHFNPLGGEDRLWLGPEGGQFSVYFAKDAPFDLAHWYVPSAFDTQPFEVIERADDRVAFQSSFELTNYSGTHFQIRVRRTVRVLAPAMARAALSIAPASDLAVVAYESNNTLINAGSSRWTKDKGLLSIWILGMFNPSSTATIVIPIKPGSDSKLGKKTTSDYFGAIPTDRLRETERAVFLRADGQFRSKVGINPKRSLGKLGSYDALNHVLTVVEFDQPPGVTDFVNSLWKIQSDPFAGDVANAYNDGAPAPGVPPMGPFFELESSSPAAALAPGQRLSHTHRTFHIIGPEAELDTVSRTILGLSLAEINTAFLPGTAAPSRTPTHPGT